MSAVEFALVAPVLLLLLLLAIDLGRALHHTAAIEKGARSGALFAARSPLPLTAATRQIVENLVRTGQMDAGAPLIASGWDDPAATLEITHETTYEVETGVYVPIVRIAASVPFDPLLPGLIAGFGLVPEDLSARHVQPYVGD